MIRAKVARVLGCALLVVAALLPAAGAQEFSPVPAVGATHPQAVTVRLRVSWDCGDAARAWRGSATLAGGVLSEVVPWGRHADTPSVAGERGGSVVIAPLSPVQGGAFGVTATGPPDSVFRLELADGSREPAVMEVTLRQLLDAPQSVALGGEGGGADGVLRVDRAEADSLRVSTGREQLIFMPGEHFAFKLQALLPQQPARTPLDLQVELLKGRGGGDAFDSQVQRVTADELGACEADFDLALPMSEGVYTVRMSARRPAGFLRGWGKGAGKPLAERVFELLVWDAGQSTQAVDEEKLVVEIDPTSSRWWLRMPEWKWTQKVPWYPKGPQGSEPADVVNDERGRWVQLKAAADPAEANWQSYPLPIDEPGAPHILEIEIPDDRPQSLNVVLFDRDSIGRAAPLGDSLTVVSGRGRAAGTRAATVARRLFWPATDSPLLVISNDGDSPALYGRVRVLSLKRETAPSLNGQAPAERPILADLSSASLAAAVHATLKPSPDGTYVHEDWQTFYDASLRLADYVRIGGFNGAVVTVAAGGGTVYPTAVLGGQCGLDWEIVAAGATDVPRKDLLELLLREFDRRGLRLTLAMDLSSAIPSVELARAGGDTSVDALNADGQRPPDAPVQYNPLNPRVRAALVAAVAEVARKGRGHESFAGIAIDLKPTGHAGLRGDMWCADPQTFDAFLQSSGLQWPAEAPRSSENIQRALVGAWNPAWREWRAGMLASLYGQMAHALAGERPDAQLRLVCDELFSDGAGFQALRPRFEGRVHQDAMLSERGIDRRRVETPPNLSLVTPRYADLPARLNDAAHFLQLNDMYWADRSAAGGREASDIVRPTRSASLPGFKARSPFGAAQTFTAATLGPVTFGGRSTSELVTVALSSPAAEVWDDATTLPVDHASRELRGLLRQAPAEAAATPESRQQPLVVWRLASQGHTHLLVGNPTDWPLKATLTLDAPEPCLERRLAADASQQAPEERLAAGKHTLPVELGAQEVAVFHLDSEAMGVAGVRTESQPDAAAAFAGEVELLGRRDLNARLPFTGCANLSFETIDADGLPVGWRQVGATGLGGVRSSNKSAVDGQACVLITAGADPVSLVSAPFAAPESRQLVITFFVRPERRSPNSRLTIRYVTDDAGAERFTTIAGNTFGDDPGWRQFAFYETLPLGVTGPVRVEFEARDLEVSIDKLDMQALAFPLDYELGGEARRQRLALVQVLQSAKSALADGRLTDCGAILDGYWARFLTEHTPLAPLKPAPAVAADDPQPSEEPPKTTGRWRSYLQGLFR